MMNIPLIDDDKILNATATKLIDRSPIRNDSIDRFLRWRMQKKTPMTMGIASDMANTT